MLKEAEDKGYLVTAGTDGVSDQTVNKCGITNAHAFSILRVFELKDQFDLERQMYLIRNPWNNTKFNQNWNYEDPKWTLKALK